MTGLHLVPPPIDTEKARLVDRLLNPAAEDIVHWERFERMRELVANCRAAIGPLTENQRQLVGLYILSAVWLGEGSDYDPCPTLDVPKPLLTVVP